MGFRSLQTRIAVFFVALLVLIQTAEFILVNTTNQRIARETIGQDLQTGERIFRRLLEQNKNQLEQSATILSLDFAFREAIATRDVGTILSVLKNHGARAKASMVTLVSLDGIVLADTLQPITRGRPFQFKTLIDAAQTDGKSSGIVIIEGALYQLVVVPVLVPEPIAWVALGFLVDDRAAQDLQKVSALDVSFISRKADQAWRVLASTHSTELRAQLATSLVANKQNETFSTELSGVQYETRVTPLGQHGDVVIASVLQRSLAEGLKPFAQVSQVFLWLVLFSVVISIVGSVLIARNIARPLNELTTFARKIKEGEYHENVNIKQEDEIGALASSFEHMRESISARQKEILQLAYTDSLTGLPNRVMFNERLKQSVMQASQYKTHLTVMILDLDRFKYINDNLGHNVGDQVLREVGTRLSQLVAAPEMVARLGGDEFAVLLVSANRDRVSNVVQDILLVLEAPIVLENQPIDVGASIGIANYPEHGDDASTLMRRADIAMYMAKGAKSGFAIYDDRRDQHRQEHLTLLSELRRAVELNELTLHYQPKVRVRDGELEGVEALIRWEHPVRGFVSPAEFIPFVEQTGYIKTITRWVINSAMAQSSQWTAHGLHLRVSINISARDLVDRELPHFIAGALRTHDVAPESFCLEITESALMEDPPRVQDTLKLLRGLGVGLSLDDYGTGYSSLVYLKNLSVNELKIDQRFIANVQSDAQNQTIVRSTIELGHNLGIQVAAEGVESAQELKELRQLGCDYVQGYYIARPMPASAFQAWLDKTHANRAWRA